MGGASFYKQATPNGITAPNFENLSAIAEIANVGNRKRFSAARRAYKQATPNGVTTVSGVSPKDQ